MESLVSLLPKRPQPLLARYGLSALMVLVSFALSLGIPETMGLYGFIMFVPAIVAASFIFDRGTGLFAIATSIALISARVPWEENPAAHIVSLTLFGLVSACVVLVGEGMRKALERAVEVRCELEALLQEQGHRIKNNFAIASSLTSLQARAHRGNPEVKAALESAIERLHVLAESHDHLRFRATEHMVDMREFLTDLCWKIAESHRGIRPVAVEVVADQIFFRTGNAHRVGLIVNELVINALKYAFPEDASGRVTVEFRATDGGVRLTVEDNGRGCPDDVKEGLGSHLIRLFVQQLRGAMVRGVSPAGCRVTIDIPTPASE